MLPECWPAVELFLACETQWRFAGMSGLPTGIDYGVLPVVAAPIGVSLDREVMEDLRTMEGEAVKVFVEKWKRK